ncbi:NAD(+) diphosphatase [Neptuniibacter sp. CAU 1671]|uniref:NAD(+) diphosphatase n=1 Tax=Neptuniibacter sp. CAU 1671 TaxID=3032593 RepID=UPI0023DCC3D2|nr:NAD(+) diphosphatase [Neptuniibacter sp. CAU 1671]MDF2180838.1 NAD(+) diphosphatase [Neptuniibacter sp. CAU 1671]
MTKTFWLAQRGKLLMNSAGIICLAEKALTGLAVESIIPVTDDPALPQIAILSETQVYPAAEPANLRQLLAQAEDDETYFALSRGAQLVSWLDQFRHCPRCATPLKSAEDELARVCEPCQYRHYPKINPCVIVLVRKGDRCLLAHASRFADGRYSLLAGFIEAGESAEATVAREVMEEVGIRVTNVRYIKSQSWPFPHSLMLGFFADYAGGEIQPDGTEITHADWFGLDDLPILPPHFSIARQLLDQFFMEQYGHVPQESAPFFPTE